MVWGVELAGGALLCFLALAHADAPLLATRPKNAFHRTIFALKSTFVYTKQAFQAGSDTAVAVEAPVSGSQLGFCRRRACGESLLCVIRWRPGLAGCLMDALKSMITATGKGLSS